MYDYLIQLPPSDDVDRSASCVICQRLSLQVHRLKFFEPAGQFEVNGNFQTRQQHRPKFSADVKSADCQLKCMKLIMIQSVGRRLIEIMADAYYFWIMSVSHALSSWFLVVLRVGASSSPLHNTKSKKRKGGW